MHEYRDSRIARLMLKVNAKVSDIDLFIATTMLQMAGIEHGGRSLILGVGLSTFACALGSRDFGHKVVGIAFHAANVHQQNFLRNKLRSRATFTYSTTKDLLLAMPVFTWNFVFVLPGVGWDAVEGFVLDKMKDAKIVVAQKFPVSIDLEDYEHQAFRVTKAGYCLPVTDEDGEWVIFKVR